MPILSTYRVQLTPDFGFDDAAAIVPYLAELGVTHLYCSPWLQAAPGSQHGYDVVDHTSLNVELGGDEAHARLVAAVREHGLGIVVDIVPNHMAVSEPESQNSRWWGLLRDGRSGEDARWFDIDWDRFDGRVLVPVLGEPLAEVQLKADGGILRYYDHEVPASPHVRLADWHTASEDLNYRRFFDVTTLAGIRVEDPVVFDESHALILSQVRSGVIDGLRIDHPDGLADPSGYLARLASHTGGLWTVVEKILEPGEELPAAWRCAGTTGYDALNLILGSFVDQAAAGPLTDLYAELTGETGTYPEVVDACKRQVLDTVLSAEVNRLTRLVVAALPEAADVTTRGVREALVELLTAFDVYRAYLPEPASVERLGEAVDRAQQAHPLRSREISLVANLVEFGPEEIVTRFQQTCGPVMAKGVEDTAFYRYHRLTALNEVGGDPGEVGTSSAEFHEWCERMQRDWPLTMTSLSTHDTKRSEDVRARLVQLSHDVEGWSSLAREGMSRLGSLGPAVDANTRYLLLQTMVGVWGGDDVPARLAAYLEKATREAKRETNWTSPDSAYDEAVQSLVRAACGDPHLGSLLDAWTARHAHASALTGRAMKLVQLTMPGVADCYQGTETESLALVDPDNRRPVDYAALAASLADGSDPKQRVVRECLQLRKKHPEWFGVDATYEALDAGDGALAFVRSGALVTVVPTGPASGAANVQLPPGRWQDVLSDRWHEGLTTVAGLVGTDLGVALLVRSH